MMMIRIMVGVISLLALSAPLVSAMSGSPQELQADLAISHVKVVSPPSLILDDATVAITGNRIQYVGNSGIKITAKRTIDGTGKTLIPGLIDTHVHLIMGPDSPADDAAYDRWVSEKLPNNFADLLSRGFTTLLSTGDYWPQLKRVQNKLASGELKGPRLFTLGPVITPVNGHVAADNASCTKVPFCRAQLTREIANLEQGLQVIRQLAAEGVNGIKISTAAGNANYKTNARFEPAVMKAMFDEAHKLGLITYAHAYPYDIAIEAIEAGADRLVHGPELMGGGHGLVNMETSSHSKDDLIALALAKDIAITSTIAVFATYRDNYGVERAGFGPVYGDDSNPEMIKAYTVFRKGYKDIKYFADKGVKIAWGTDVWPLFRLGDAQKYSMQEYMKTGLTPMQILATATINAAAFIGKEKELGSIETGKLADLTLVAGDPLKNMDFLDRIDLVIKDGKVVFDHYAQ